MDIWQSGGYADGSGGEAPAAFAFIAAAKQVLTFSTVSGVWTCAGTVPPNGPDGTNSTSPHNCYVEGNIFAPIGPFSGLNLTDFSRPLVGMFLEDTLPVAPPPTLRFFWSDASQGGTQTNFAVISPQIGQVFFVGDGKTGTGNGAIQAFNVPATATHLYLGYVDLCANGGPPGCYNDNAGSITATFAISQCSFQVGTVSAQVQLADRAWATQGAVMLSWRSGRQVSPAAIAAIADSVAPTTTTFATAYRNGGKSGCAQLNNCSISQAEYSDFITRIGYTMIDTNPSSPSACGIATHLRKYGPMSVVIGRPTPNFVPAGVITGIGGDGTNSGSAVNLIDLATGEISSESSPELLLQMEVAVAEGWAEFAQYP